MGEFTLRPDERNPNFMDVIYPEGPRYMINVTNWTCTCKGSTIKNKCKHLSYLLDMSRIHD